MDYKGSETEVNTLPSKTQPDMTLSMRELLVNHTRNLGLPGTVYEPMYYDVEIPQMDDITDIEEYRQFLQDEKAESEKRLEELLRHKRQLDEHDRKRQEVKKSLEDGTSKTEE